VYRDTLIKKAHTNAIKRVFSVINTALFGTESIVSDTPVIDDGNYESDLEELNNALDAEPAVTMESGATPRPPAPPQFHPSGPVFTLSITFHSVFPPHLMFPTQSRHRHKFQMSLTTMSTSPLLNMTPRMKRSSPRARNQPGPFKNHPRHQNQLQ
jgi:hypothetical protein